MVTDTRVRGLIRDGEVVERFGPGDVVELVLDRTPLYAESGGQLADHGRIRLSGGALLEVTDVQRPITGLVVHRATVLEGEGAVGEDAEAEVDVVRRRSISRAHTATHMVHQALRDELGDTATQAGSENSPGRLRFDFRSQQAVPVSAMGEIEARINDVLLDDLPVTADVMAIDDARRLGAMALFGEKYGERVRVVSIGEWSRELCIGTHTPRVGQIGVVKLLGESSIGSGVRRVEALVGADAYTHLAREASIVSQLTEVVGGRRDELPDRVAGILSRLREAEKEIAAVKQAQVLGAAQRTRAERARRRRSDLRQPRRGRRRVGRRAARARARRARPTRQRAPGAGVHGGRVGRSAVRHRRDQRAGPPAGSAGRSPRQGGGAGARWRWWRQAGPRAGRRHRPHAGLPGSRCRRGPASSSRRMTSPDASVARHTRPGVRVGVDVGSARVGVAASDAAATFVHPVRTLARDEQHGTDLSSLTTLVEQLEAVEVIVGLPLLLSGEEGEAARLARAYAAALAVRVAPVTVRLVDERLTTVDAHRRLRDSGVPGRSQRKVVDQAAAVIILQNALDTEASSGRPPGEAVTTGGRRKKVRRR